MKQIYYSIFLLLTFFSLTALAQSTWDINKLNTAKNSTSLTQIEKDVILELNKVRSNPSQYAKEYISELINKYKNDEITMNEGLPALEECYNVLIKQKPLCLFSNETGLNLSAKLLAYDLKNTGNLGMLDSKGRNPYDRIMLFGTKTGCWGESLKPGEMSAQDIVTGLLIDDGLNKRYNRKNILNKDFDCVGVSIVSHNESGSVCVIDFAGGYKTNKKYLK